MRKAFASFTVIGTMALLGSAPVGAQQTAQQIAQRVAQDDGTARLVELAERNEQQRDAMLVLLLGGLTIGVLLHWRGTRRIVELESMSLTDPLTGVRNRRYLEQTIDLDVASSLRAYRDARASGATPGNADLVFLMIDLDTFKAINDTYGHQVGDRVLSAVAAALQRTCRDSDLLVRWGGDEFLVVERFADRAEAVIAGERFRAALEAAAIVLPSGERVAITCSIGYASFPFMTDDPDVLGWEQVVTLADLAAYSVKRDGRNGVSGYVSVVPVAPPQIPFADLTELDSLLRLGHVKREIKVTTEIVPSPDGDQPVALHASGVADGPRLRINP
ncbi:MAG TPA: GGDEF domain-containing protein [Gemmatimonadaceae bacterium]|nr:GGDEF domain-containing protein [Gemmatimonadaceae bacterium]